MAMTCMTPLLPELIVARETGGKHAVSVTRQKPSRFEPTLKAIEALSVPYLLTPADGSPVVRVSSIDDVFRRARELGGRGCIWQRGKQVAFWGYEEKP